MSLADFYLELVSWGKVKGCVDELFRVSWDPFRSSVGSVSFPHHIYSSYI